MEEMTKAQRQSFEARSRKITNGVLRLAWDDFYVDDQVRHPVVDDQEVVRSFEGSRAGVRYTVIVLGRRERS